MSRYWAESFCLLMIRNNPRTSEPHILRSNHINVVYTPPRTSLTPSLGFHRWWRFQCHPESRIVEKVNPSSPQSPMPHTHNNPSISRPSNFCLVFHLEMVLGQRAILQELTLAVKLTIHLPASVKARSGVSQPRYPSSSHIMMIQ